MKTLGTVLAQAVKRVGGRIATFRLFLFRFCRVYIVNSIAREDVCAALLHFLDFGLDELSER
jgi:hypothetical protein